MIENDVYKPQFIVSLHFPVSVFYIRLCESTENGNIIVLVWLFVMVSMSFPIIPQSLDMYVSFKCNRSERESENNFWIQSEKQGSLWNYDVP